MKIGTKLNGSTSRGLSTSEIQDAINRAESMECPDCGSDGSHKFLGFQSGVEAMWLCDCGTFFVTWEKADD